MDYTQDRLHQLEAREALWLDLKSVAKGAGFPDRYPSGVNGWIEDILEVARRIVNSSDHWDEERLIIRLSNILKGKP